MLTLDTIRQAPKALLHDHLDGGLRPATVVDLAARVRLRRAADDRRRRPRGVVPPRRRPEVARAVPRDVRAHDRRAPGSRRDHPRRRRVRRGPRRRRRRLRRGALRPGAVDREGPDPRRGRRREPRGLPHRQPARRRGGQPDRHEGPRHGDAPGRAVGRGRRVRRSAGATPGVVGFDIAGPEAGYRPTRHLEAFDKVRHENFHITIHAGEGFGLPSIWEALQFCGAERLGPRRAHRRRHRGPRRRLGRARPARGVRARPARPARDVPDLERPLAAPRRPSRRTRSTCSAGCASA